MLRKSINQVKSWALMGESHKMKPIKIVPKMSILVEIRKWTEVWAKTSASVNQSSFVDTSRVTPIYTSLENGPVRLNREKVILTMRLLDFNFDP